MQVIVDTREQKPWQFSNAVEVIRGTLKTGDYSLVGYEDLLCVERKSLGDFVGTVIGDWLRFRKELVRMSAMDAACIVVEADVRDVLEHKYESEAKPESVLGRAHGIYADHGVPVFWWGSREQCAGMVEQYLRIMHKKLR